jgi:hypothetical protein
MFARDRESDVTTAALEFDRFTTATPHGQPKLLGEKALSFYERIVHRKLSCRLVAHSNLPIRLSPAYPVPRNRLRRKRTNTQSLDRGAGFRAAVGLVRTLRHSD